ncbi:MAG: alkaline phosphatase family protein [Verrucomicrobiota bacterium]|nr:alkaline phosphatase family protein [Verrucomicrobiota bacterium]
MRSRLLVLGAVIFCAAVSCKHAKHQHAKYVVLMVWDGMRPDFVTETGTPNLWKLAQGGVTFRNHHSFYPTATNVNGTVMATGVFPNRSGVIANVEYRPVVDPRAPIDTAVRENIVRGDQITAGKYLSAPTIVELLQASGKRTAVAGSKWVAKLFDRSQERASEIARKSDALSGGEAQPTARELAIQNSLGQFPKREIPNAKEDAWTTAALTETMWKNHVAPFSVLWLSDPDFTQHDVAPGSPEALAAMKSVDACLGKVIDALTTKQVREQTDILVVSDHGFSTVEHEVDVAALLDAAGFKAAKQFENEPVPGTILTADSGATILFYVIGRDEKVTLRLVEWLQQRDFAGPIFTREKMEGTFSLADAHLDNDDGPDVVMAFRWNDKTNKFGTQGLIDAEGRAAGHGTHATLSRFDVHNTLIAAGPDFRVGYKSDLASGNIDVAATILHIFGITPPQPLDGRILSEAMKDGSNAPAKTETRTLETSRNFTAGTWRQYLKITHVAGHDYIDEGNASLTSPSTR